ncbi:zinc finger protein 664 [Anabrus simplex]|uniref:zinc finger protein 664 n=1 Tax=Anabrus simplex TaxID=316456 RepID=UPI0035A2CD01
MVRKECNISRSNLHPQHCIKLQLLCEMDSEVQIKEEPVCLEEIASTSLENFELPSKMTSLKAEAKSELMVPGPTQQNTFQASVKVKDEIFMEEQAIHQLVPCVKEENHVENIGILINRPLPSWDKAMKQEIHQNRHLLTESRRLACISNGNNKFKPRRHQKSNSHSHFTRRPNRCKTSNVSSVQTVDKHFICTECKRTCLSKRDLEMHLRVHSGERPFCCALCDSRFKQKGDLKRHLQAHSAMRPYLCFVCGKSFSRKFGLKRHMLLHYDEKPFSCSVCGGSKEDILEIINHELECICQDMVKAEVFSQQYAQMVGEASVNLIKAVISVEDNHWIMDALSGSSNGHEPGTNVNSMEA